MQAVGAGSQGQVIVGAADSSCRLLGKLLDGTPCCCTATTTHVSTAVSRVACDAPALGFAQLPWLSVQKVSGKTLCLSSARGGDQHAQALYLKSQMPCIGLYSMIPAVACTGTLTGQTHQLEKTKDLKFT